MINRRNFLKNASLFTLGGLMAGKVGNAVAAQPATSAAFEATAAKNIGLQIYSLGDELYKDVTRIHLNGQIQLCINKLYQ